MTLADAAGGVLSRNRYQRGVEIGNAFGQAYLNGDNSLKANMSRLRAKSKSSGYTIEPVRFRDYIFTKL